MLRNLVKRHMETEVTYELRFFTDPNGGFAFPCNADGMVIRREMSDAAIENYKYALEHPENFPYCYNELHKNVLNYIEPANGICDCGARVYLENQYLGACECPQCGQWYNLSGQKLLSPDRWEE